MEVGMKVFVMIHLVSAHVGNMLPIQKMSHVRLTRLTSNQEPGSAIVGHQRVHVGLMWLTKWMNPAQPKMRGNKKVSPLSPIEVYY